MKFPVLVILWLLNDAVFKLHSYVVEWDEDMILKNEKVRV